MAELEINLPEELVSPADVRRLARDAARLADVEQQIKLGGDVREGGGGSALLRKFAAANRLDLSKVEGCQQASKLLDRLVAEAPVVHISFASEASDDFIQKISGWFRKNISPLVLLTVGLQPSLAAGCYLRTTNRYFDLSLRQHLESSRGLLAEELEGLARE